MTSTARKNTAALIAVSVIAIIAIVALVVTLSGVLSNKADSAPAVEAAPAQAAPASTQSSSDRFIISYAQDSSAAQAIQAAKVDGSNIIDALPPEAKDVLTSAAQAASVDIETVTAHSLAMLKVELSSALTPEQVKSFLASVGAADDVEAVEPEMRVTAMDENVPNDEHFPLQWNLTSNPYSVSATNAWSQTTGKDVTVAVIDSGVLVDHPDLEGQLLPGYDFISDPWTARDGDGRDADPNDEGDSSEDEECGPGSPAIPSSWHGSHVAGIIAAATNNSTGVAGVAPGAKIVPVRAIGRCGGSGSDILDALTWAAGGRVNGVPDNPNPAKIINMSLGGTGVCPFYYQRAIDAATERGSIVVVSAGNEDIDVSMVAPASCDNVITVGASTAEGGRASYSNYGVGVDVSAPGGDEVSGGIASLSDRSESTPQERGYRYMAGTSQAAPHVSGTIALLTELKPAITAEEAKTLLQSTSTAMSSCDRSGCGNGVISSTQAVDQLVKDLSEAPAPDPSQAPSPEPEPSTEPSPSPSEPSLEELLDELLRQLEELSDQ